MVLHQLQYHLDMVSESRGKMIWFYLQELKLMFITVYELAMYYFLRPNNFIQLPVRRLKASTVESGYLVHALNGITVK